MNYVRRINVARTRGRVEEETREPESHPVADSVDGDCCSICY
jgi:hypothetical protein